MTDLNMTIDDFMPLMLALGERFDRTVGTNMIAGYFKYLSENLQPDQIQTGFENVFNQDTFFPTPERWLQAATGNLETAALAQWDETLAASRENRSSNLDTLAKATWRSLGGREILDKGDSRMFLQIRGKFLEEYTTRARAARVNTKALPASAADLGTGTESEPVQTRVPDTFEEWEAMQKAGAA